jgi:hypothetical protein
VVVFGGDPDHSARMQTDVTQDDYSVVVKYRAKPPSPWRWEIYCAGRKNSIVNSSIYFPTMASANRAGKEALKQFLVDRQSPRYGGTLA